MGRPVLSICTRCEVSKKDRREGLGPEELYEAVRAIRRERGLKEVFKVEEADCLSMCDEPCAITLEGSKRSTYRRSRVRGVPDAVGVVEMAVAYANLRPGEELPERSLPGRHED